jgi:hypothetical protein
VDPSVISAFSACIDFHIGHHHFFFLSSIIVSLSSRGGAVVVVVVVSTANINNYTYIITVTPLPRSAIAAETTPCAPP